MLCRMKKLLDWLFSLDVLGHISTYSVASQRLKLQRFWIGSSSIAVGMVMQRNMQWDAPKYEPHGAGIEVESV